MPAGFPDQVIDKAADVARVLCNDEEVKASAMTMEPSGKSIQFLTSHEC